MPLQEMDTFNLFSRITYKHDIVETSPANSINIYAKLKYIFIVKKQKLKKGEEFKHGSRNVTGWSVGDVGVNNT